MDSMGFFKREIYSEKFVDITIETDLDAEIDVLSDVIHFFYKETIPPTLIVKYRVFLHFAIF